MKAIRKTKFTLEKFEVAKLNNAISIFGGTLINGELDDITRASRNCSYFPDCNDPKPQPPVPPVPQDPQPIPPSQ